MANLEIPENIKEKLLTPAGVNDFIHKGIVSNKGFLISRFGSIEGSIATELILRGKHKVDEKLEKEAKNNAGISQPTMVTLRKFGVEYLNSASKADLMAIWNFPDQVRCIQFSRNKAFCFLNQIDPVYSFHNNCIPVWTNALKGKKILLIHPFVETIKAQYKNRENIAIISEILPDFELLTLSPPVTNGSTDNGVSWLDELASLKKQVLKIDFDVAIIGAGAYGLPIGSFIKDIDKVAIHLGGVTQLLFGIIGNRWELKVQEGYADIMKGNNWVRPLVSETPVYSTKIEKGCYW